MNKIFTIAVLAAETLMLLSCSKADSIEPTQVQLQQAAIAAAQSAVNAVASIDHSAAGMSESEISVAFSWTTGRAIDAIPLATTRVLVSLNISEDETWTNDNIYQLDGRITVLDGATLTIEEGTRIEGNSNLQGENAAVLMIARGGKLFANGTAKNPIIMTATADDGTLDASDKGLWGGLIILGKAPVSAKVDNPQIEGVKSVDINGQYGGTDVADNSGVIRYVSIKHGGAVIDAVGDEINGLTLGGVGYGTTIENIWVFANRDDGIEFFGGTVNVDYVLITQVGDDALDIDQSYAGTVTNFAIFVDDDSDEALEIDGRERDLDESFTITKGTAIGVDGASVTCDFKSKAKGTISSFNANGGKIKLSASFDIETLKEEEDAAYNVVKGELSFSTTNAQFSVYTNSFNE
jgi:hypothetical protein